MQIFIGRNNQKSGLKVVLSVLVGVLVLGLGILKIVGAQLKTVSFPTKDPQITFEISKDATQLVKNENLCFKYGFVVCVVGNLKETTAVGDNEIKEAEEELTKELTETMTGVLKKEHGATNIHVNRTGHFKTAKGVLIFYTEATYKNPEQTEMICLNHLLASKKGMFVFQGYARQTEKDAFYDEMRRLLDSISL